MQSAVAAECDDNQFETSSNINVPNVWEFGHLKSPNDDGSFTFRQFQQSDFDQRNQHTNIFNNFASIDSNNSRYSPDHEEGDVFNNNHRQYTANYADDAITQYDIDGHLTNTGRSPTNLALQRNIQQ